MTSPSFEAGGFRRVGPPAESSLHPGLRHDVEELSRRIGERNDQSPSAREGLSAAARFVEQALAETGRSLRRVPVADGIFSIEALAVGKRPGREVVIAAHYDTLVGRSGIDDDASGVAVLLAVARLLAGRELRRTTRIVALANELYPHRGEDVGSRVYARGLRAAGVDVHGLLSLESVGFFKDRHTRRPPPKVSRSVLPWTGDFIAFVGDRASAHFVAEVRESFAFASRLAVRDAALSVFLPGAFSPAQRAFRAEGYRAVTVTDTGPRSAPYPSQGNHVSDLVDYGCMADLAFGLATAVTRLTETCSTKDAG